MEIQTKNGDTEEWGKRPLNVPYNGTIYVDGDVKMYDSTYTGSDKNNLKVVKTDASGDEGERLNAAQYTLQVGLPTILPRTPAATCWWPPTAPASMWPSAPS